MLKYNAIRSNSIPSVLNDYIYPIHTLNIYIKVKIKVMKKALLVIIIFLLALTNNSCSLFNFKRMSPEEVKEITEKARKSKLIVLDVYHNRCESCKYIAPVIKKLESMYSQNPNVAFLKYDLSNPFTVSNSRQIAKSLGLDPIYKSQRYSGIVLFIDNEKKEVINTLIAEYNIDKYIEVIEARH